jgi:hypothetical protein
MVAKVGATVIGTAASTGPAVLALPSGAAAGDLVVLFWSAQHNNPIQSLAVPNVVNANGIEYALDYYYNPSSPDGLGNWGTIGFGATALTAADIALGTYEFKTPYPVVGGHTVTYNADIVVGIAVYSAGYRDFNYPTGGSFNPYVSYTVSNDGLGVWFGATWDDASGTDPTSSDLPNFAFARGTDGRIICTAGDFSYTAGSVAEYHIDANTTYNADTQIGVFVGIADAVTATIDVPADLTLAGDAPDPSPVPSVVVDSPVALVLTGGSPLVYSPSAAAVVIDTPAVLTITGEHPTWIADNFLPPILIQADISVALAGLIQALPDDAMTPYNSILAVGWMSAHMEVSPPLLEIISLPLNQQRLIDGIVVTHSTPIVSNGKPTLPKYAGVYPSAMPLIVGQLDTPPDHIHSIADPDPVWNPATSGWYYPPPSSGVGDCRWTVQTLPDPSPYPGQYYWLGDPSSSDGTSGIEAGARQWAPDASTPGAPQWHSKFPYKPSVRAHVSYGPSGNLVTQSKGVRFNLQYIEHMWAAFSSLRSAPFTWVIVGIIMDFPTNGYTHTILDVGGDPNSYGAPGLGVADLGIDHGLTDLGLDSPHRTLLQVNLNSQTQEANLSGSQAIVTPFNYAARPKMAPAPSAAR